MKICRTCNQLYSDESFFYCLHDGSGLADLSDAEETLVLPSMSSVVTIVSKETAPAAFQGKYVFEETAYDDLSLKILSSDEDEVKIGFKIEVKNLAVGPRDLFMRIAGMDEDGFEIADFLMTGKKIHSGQIRSLTTTSTFEHDTLRAINNWIINDVSSYE